MGIFTGFERGSGGRYVYDEEARKLIKVSDKVTDPNAGFNGPVWFPKGGHSYFDKALQRTFYSKEEKKAYMREHKIIQQAPDRCGDQKVPEAGLGKRMYFSGVGGRKTKYYKYNQ